MRTTYDPPMRPIPVHRRGPRRSKAARPRTHLLACPRVSPEWELDAFHALIKPRPERAALLKAEARQSWSRAAHKVMESVRQAVEERLGFRPRIEFAAAGDYHFVAEITDDDLLLARAMAWLLSRRLPVTWFVVGRIFVRDGRFFRRARGYKLNLVEASNVHLPRDVRAALRGA